MLYTIRKLKCLMAHDGAYLRPLSLIDPLVPRTSSWELGRQA